MKMFSKLKEIIEAYSIMMSPDDRQTQIAMERLMVCNECPANKVNSAGIRYCGECGCVIKAKVFSTKNSCPLNKWEK
jgi:hypothetical protein